MIDLGLSKMALIGVVALIVIGPERLPKVARTVGTLLGRAQRYVNEVKAEVSREMELDELKRMRNEFEEAANSVQQTVQTELRQTEDDFNETWGKVTAGLDGTAENPMDNPSPEFQASVMPSGRHGRDSWRVKRGALPQWYKRSQGLRGRVQSGAARVKRHRVVKTVPRSFF